MNVYKYLILGTLLCVSHDSALAMQEFEVSESKELSSLQELVIQVLEDFEEGYSLLRSKLKMFESLNRGDFDKILLTLSFKKLLSMRDENGNSFLHRAAKNNDSEFVKICILVGLPIDEKNAEYKTPFVLADEAGRTEVCEILKINLNLLEFARSGNLDGVREVLQAKAYKAYIDVRDKWTSTPLLWAVEQRDAKIVQLLIIAGASVSSKKNNGMFPLLRAAYWGLEDIVGFLVVRACVDDVGPDNRTSLWWAACRGHVSVVQQLLAKGADKTIKDTVFKYTALDIARENEHAAVVALLEDQPA